jgi:hypothetical protein
MGRKKIDEGTKKAISEMEIFKEYMPNRATALHVLETWKNQSLKEERQWIRNLLQEENIKEIERRIKERDK